MIKHGSSLSAWMPLIGSINDKYTCSCNEYRMEAAIQAVECFDGKNQLCRSSAEASGSGLHPSGMADNHLKELYSLTDVPRCKDRAVLKIQWVPQQKVDHPNLPVELILWGSADAKP